MDDAGGVDRLQRLRRLDGDLERARGRERARREHAGQVAPLHQLHDEEPQPSVLAVFVDAADVGMGDPPGQTNLGEEAAARTPASPAISGRSTLSATVSSITRSRAE